MSLLIVSSVSESFIVATCRHDHFMWLAFDAHQRFFDFKINILLEFVSGSSRLLNTFMVRHVLYSDSPLIQNKEY